MIKCNVPVVTWSLQGEMLVACRAQTKTFSHFTFHISRVNFINYWKYRVFSNIS